MLSMRIRITILPNRGTYIPVIQTTRKFTHYSQQNKHSPFRTNCMLSGVTLDKRSRYNVSHVLIPSLLIILSSSFFFASFLSLKFQFFFLFLHFRHRFTFLSFSPAHLLLFMHLHPILHVILFLAFLLLKLFFLNHPTYNSPFLSTFLFFLFFIILYHLGFLSLLLILHSLLPH